MCRRSRKGPLSHKMRYVLCLSYHTARIKSKHFARLRKNPLPMRPKLERAVPSKPIASFLRQCVQQAGAPVLGLAFRPASAADACGAGAGVGVGAGFFQALQRRPLRFAAEGFCLCPPRPPRRPFGRTAPCAGPLGLSPSFPPANKGRLPCARKCARHLWRNGRPHPAAP